ncbi:MAG TPA: hypothetical protein VHU13_09150 [Solirubrobacteraceae bacterium]|jgi:hypothetical protein|nr:hypothetical protein [Solirubrobacteraceae bacterium]
MTTNDLDARWVQLSELGETFTCYSAAIATWAAFEREDWRSAIDPGLTLKVFPAGDGLFGFVHFPAGLRRDLQLVRSGPHSPGSQAVEAVLAELERCGRAIVAGDGFRLPWHVAHGRHHVPHWYVLGGTPDRLVVSDPFACRNELGTQHATRTEIARDDLGEVLVGLPGGDPVFELRERLAFGDDCPPPPGGSCHWFVRAAVEDLRVPAGAEGPDAVSELANGIRERGQDPGAYAQADDVWSIARHRAFLATATGAKAAQSGDGALADWVREQAEPLAKRWAHMAPLLMQARLSLAAGRPASASVPDTLEELSERERTAARTLPVN